MRQQRIHRRDHIAIVVAAGRDRVEAAGMDRLRRRTQIDFADAMGLDRLARGEAQAARAVTLRHCIHRQPLRGRHHAARQAQAQEE